MRFFSATIKCRKTPLLVLAILLALNGEKSFIAPVSGRTNVHIVYMGERQHNDPELVTESHHEILASVLGSKEAAADSMIYSYRHGFSGFAAKLSESQVEQISRLPGVIKVSPNHSYKLETTRSWDFLGLPITSASSNDLLHKANMGDGVIVGVFDSGLWPESEQYNDEGLGPIPSRWKGKCVSGESFDAKKNCNRKLIGAKWYNAGLIAEFGNVINTTYREYMSARDAAGHGTHTSTTATGSIVHNVSYNGLAMGTVRGGAPRARVAMYKTCWAVPLPAKECTTADLMKAFDDAIHDGVDLLSLSLGYPIPMFAEVDPNELVMYGAFHAVARGISVICAAGNFGPYSETVLNISPWATTVAALNMDRNFPTKVALGNNMFILGQSLYTGKEINFTALMHAEDIPTGPTVNSTCENISFNNNPATGKVVLCFSRTMNGDDIEAAANATLQAGGVGLIVAKNPTSAMTNVAPDFPQVFVDYELGYKILFYIRSTSSPKVRISPAKTLVGKPVGTYVARFSSRGPNSIAPAILKPDVAAPGVNILSSIVDGFVFVSGTSMATPHVAGIVALLKVLRPEWSPAAIRSALTTTAWKTDPFGEPIFAEDFPRKLADPFDYGGGLVNPDKVAEPGLVYDMGINDYIHYLCAVGTVGYNETSISLLVGQKTLCPKPAPSILDVNVPAITIPNLKKSITLTRTVSNVGPVNSVYRAQIEPPIGISVSVNPSALVFNAKTKLLSFKVTVSTSHQVNGGYYFGSLTWTDGMHNVSSPISVRTQILELYAEDY